MATKEVSMDKDHAKLEFSANHLTISKVHGRFNNFDVTLANFDPENIKQLQVKLSAQANSVDTAVAARDGHLKSPDFFSVEAFPTITFQSTSIIEKVGNEYELNGDMTIKDVTKPVTLILIYNKSVVNPMTQKETFGFTVEGWIQRLDFNVGQPIPALVVGNRIAISSNIEFAAV